MNSLSADTYLHMVAFLNLNDHLNMRLASSWKENPRFIETINKIIVDIQKQQFVQKFGAIAICEQNIPPHILFKRVRNTLDLAKILKKKVCLHSELEAASKNPYYCGRLDDTIDKKLTACRLQLNFDKNRFPLLIESNDFSPEDKLSFYSQYHLDKIYRVMEEIFIEHAAIIKEFIEYDLTKKTAIELKNLYKRAFTIHKEQEILKAALKSTQGFYTNFCSELPLSERAFLYVSYCRNNFECKPLNLTPLPKIPRSIFLDVKVNIEKNPNLSPSYPIPLLFKIFLEI